VLAQQRKPANNERIRFGLLVKLLIPIGAALLSITAMLAFLNYQTNRQNIIDGENRQLDAAYEDFEAYIEQKSEHALSLAMQIANLPAAQVALSGQNREALERAYLSSYRELDAMFDVPQAQFHLPPATSFLRLHEPDRFGDDLSTFRFTVLNTNATQEPTYGLEVGRGGPGIRGVVPVFYADRHVGSFEIGLNINETSLQGMQAIHGGEWHLLLNARSADIATLEGFRVDAPGPVEGLLNFATTSSDFLPVSETEYEQVLTSGDTVLTRLSVGDNHYASLIAPLYDYRNRIIGVVQIDFNRNAVVADILETQLNTLVLGISVSVVMLMVMWWIIRQSLKPVRSLTAAADAITQGNMDVEIDVHSRDEVGQLAQAFKEMTASLNEMMQRERNDRAELEGTVAEYAAFVERVSAGNLAIRLEMHANGNGNGSGNHNSERHSDLYRLGGHLNSMVENLAEMAAQIRDTAAAITPAVNDFQALASQQSATFTEQNAAITQTAATVEQVRATAMQTSERAHHVMESSQESLNVSHAGESSVKDSITEMRLIRERVESIAENILRLSEQTQQIGEIIDAVNALADQSRLLALNASIEAARAGEEGKGFAVVAMEVRQLAEESSEATARIRDILQEIQQSTNTAVMVTEEGSKGAESGQAQVERTGEAIRELAAVIEQSAQAAIQIASSANQQTTGIDQLVEAMSHIRAASHETTSSAKQAEQSARDLATLAKQLEQLASRYQI
jgi:methyl-accepting chemotaxis protein